jgi:hypothetical protein
MIKERKFSDLKEKKNRTRLAGNIRQLIEDRRTRLRLNGMPVERGDEVELRANEVISRMESGEGISKLESKYWLNTGLLWGIGHKYRFSTWEHDGKKMKLKDSQIVKEGRGGTPFSKSQWMEILLENMIGYKESHFYVRDGGLVDNYLEAQRGAATRLAEHWGKGLKERTEELLAATNKTLSPINGKTELGGESTTGLTNHSPASERGGESDLKLEGDKKEFGEQGSEVQYPTHDQKEQNAMMADTGKETPPYSDQIPNLRFEEGGREERKVDSVSMQSRWSCATYELLQATLFILVRQIST